MQKYTSIILSHARTNEFNRIYMIYTREAGLMRAAGKGVRKTSAKLAGHLEPGTISEVYIARSRGMGQITSAITLNSFDGIKKDFEKLSEFFRIAKFFLKNFAEEEKDEKIFILLQDFLERLDQGSCQGLALGVEAFWWKLFDELGQRPEVMKCTVCRKKMQAGPKKYFSVKKGGIICAVCFRGLAEINPISDNQIKLLRIFWGNSFRKIAKVRIGKTELEKTKKIRMDYARYHFP